MTFLPASNSIYITWLVVGPCINLIHAQAASRLHNKTNYCKSTLGLLSSPELTIVILPTSCSDAFYLPDYQSMLENGDS